MTMCMSRVLCMMIEFLLAFGMEIGEMDFFSSLLSSREFE